MKPGPRPPVTDMRTLNCPLNGTRDINEFMYGGEYHPMPDPSHTESRKWQEYVYFHSNPAGVVIEWWCHLPSNFWFLAERDTVTEEVQRTFPFQDLVDEARRQ